MISNFSTGKGTGISMTGSLHRVYRNGWSGRYSRKRLFNRFCTWGGKYKIWERMKIIPETQGILPFRIRSLYRDKRPDSRLGESQNLLIPVLNPGLFLLLLVFVIIVFVVFLFVIMILFVLFIIFIIVIMVVGMFIVVMVMPERASVCFFT